MIQFGKDTCGDLDAALRREWLETNGLGGFASSTIVGLNTRRYHSLLVATLKPPSRNGMAVADGTVHHRIRKGQRKKRGCSPPSV